MDANSPEQAPALEPPATWWLVVLAGVAFVGHMLVAGNYGYFRDELYYIADGHHLQAGRNPGARLAPLSPFPLLLPILQALRLGAHGRSLRLHSAG